MFENILMQVANATAPLAPAGTDPNIAYIGGIVVAIVTAGAGVVRSGQLSGLLKMLRKDTEVAGQTSVAALQKGTEAKAMALQLTPDDKAELKKAIAEEVKIGMEQVNTIKGDKPQFNPNKLDMPRESFDTKPKPDTSSEEVVK